MYEKQRFALRQAKGIAKKLDLMGWEMRHRGAKVSGLMRFPMILWKDWQPMSTWTRIKLVLK